MNNQANTDRYCVIGAGPCGLTAAKNLLTQGLACDVIEREPDLGGNWHFGQASSSVYASTHLISSKTLTQFLDFPMPADYPHYPSHAQVLAYLRAYAEHFHLREQIQFNRTVERVEPAEQGWQVKLLGESESRSYRGIIVANGHHWEPMLPQFPGRFTGQVLHSHDYKIPELFRNQRVLIVGAGNSGCDIAVEAARHGTAAWLSMRRGYHFLPKFLRGLPIDLRGERLHRWGFPLWLRRMIAAFLVRAPVGSLKHYGLPAPDHRLFETHPLVNSQLLYELGHGRIKVKPNIAELCGAEVKFADGTTEQVDVIVYATGYKLSFPFLDTRWVLNEQNRLHLFLNAFHAERDDFLVAGLIQPDSGIWGLADLQCRLFAKYQVAQRESPAQAAKFKQQKSHGHDDLGNGVRYLNTPRHLLEVEYYGYRERLRKLLRMFGDKL